jgi:hypothetical protein
MPVFGNYGNFKFQYLNDPTTLQEVDEFKTVCQCNREVIMPLKCKRCNDVFTISNAICFRHSKLATKMNIARIVCAKCAKTDVLR